MRRLLAVLALAPALLSPATAHAFWFPAEPVDSGVLAFGGADLARDGTGAGTCTKAEGHVYLSRRAAGAWQPPERVDAGEAAPGTDAVVAAAAAGALIVAW